VKNDSAGLSNRRRRLRKVYDHVSQAIGDGSANFSRVLRRTRGLRWLGRWPNDAIRLGTWKADPD